MNAKQVNCEIIQRQRKTSVKDGQDKNAVKRISGTPYEAVPSSLRKIESRPCLLRGAPHR